MSCSWSRRRGRTITPHLQPLLLLACMLLPAARGEVVCSADGEATCEEQAAAKKEVSLARGVYPRGCRLSSSNQLRGSASLASSNVNVKQPPAGQNGAGIGGPRWREIRTDGNKTVEYEFWEEGSESWTSVRPKACEAERARPEVGYVWRGPTGLPRTEMSCTSTHCMYTNLWYNGGRWYALVDGEEHVPGWQLSRNQYVSTIHVHNTSAWLQSVDYRVVKGDSLLFDFIFFIHPTAIGHWCEMMFPLFSILQRTDFRRPADQFVLLHLKRWHLMEWVRAVIAVTLGVKPGEAMPPILLQEERDNIWGQLTSPLEGVPSNEWLVFERAMVVRDLFTGGRRSFQTSDDGQLFRSLIYQQYSLPPPAPRPEGPPRILTFQRKRANRRVINEDQLLAMLREFGEVRVVEFNASSSFYEQLYTMSQTGVFVSVHTSNLANAPWLPPGSAVVELIQRYWNWNGLDKSFKEQTETIGDIHHYAWRARGLNETVYLKDGDLRRFGHWSNEECRTEECVEAHTEVDVVVDVSAVRQLLADRLPLVFASKTVKEAELPWPE